MCCSLALSPSTMTYSELNIFNFRSFPVGVRFLLDGLISVSVARCELTKLSRAAGAILWCESPQRAVREMTAELQSACAHVSCLPLTRPPPEAVIESVRDCLLSRRAYSAWLFRHQQDVI